MLEFFADMSANPLLLLGLIAGWLASIACGLVGPYVITQRIVFLAGAIAHMAVGGVGVAIFLAVRWPDAFGGWLSPLIGALIWALASAWLLAWVYERASERMDTLIGAMWAVGMSIGLLLIKFTPGYHVELMNYLFGNIVMVSRSDLWLMGGLIVAIVLVQLLFHKQLMALCIDREQTTLQGSSPFLLNGVLLTMVALTVICLIQVVGLILVLALLTLPAAAAGRLTSRMPGLMMAATVIGLLCTTLPRIAVYGSRWSPESSIVLAAGAVYLASLALPRKGVRSIGAPVDAESE